MASKEVKSMCQFSHGNVKCISVINLVLQVPIGYNAINNTIPYMYSQKFLPGENFC